MKGQKWGVRRYQNEDGSIKNLSRYRKHMMRGAAYQAAYTHYKHYKHQGKIYESSGKSAAKRADRLEKKSEKYAIRAANDAKHQQKYRDKANKLAVKSARHRLASVDYNKAASAYNVNRDAARKFMNDVSKKKLVAGKDYIVDSNFWKGTTDVYTRKNGTQPRYSTVTRHY